MQGTAATGHNGIVVDGETGQEYQPPRGGAPRSWWRRLLGCVQADEAVTVEMGPTTSTSQGA